MLLKNALAYPIYSEIDRITCGSDTIATQRTPRIVSADDFTPIWVYVIFSSDVTDLYATKDFMFECACQASLNGCDGYYLTQLECALLVFEQEDVATLENTATKEGYFSKATYASVITSLDDDWDEEFFPEPEPAPAMMAS